MADHRDVSAAAGAEMLNAGHDVPDVAFLEGDSLNDDRFALGANHRNGVIGF